MTYVQGIDCSKHQGKNLDFKATQRANMIFAFVKMTEGVGYIDSEFKNNWRKLVDLDGQYIRGVYHFARPDTVGGRIDGENEARYMVRVLKSNGHWQEGCLPPALDYEKYCDSGPRENIEWVRGFVEVVEAELGRTPIIYTGRNVWRHELGDTREFVRCPLWQVRYTKEPQPVPMPWPTWTFWQWSGGKGKDFDHRFWMMEHGKMPGVASGYCDVNRFKGTKEELWKLAMLSAA